MFMKKCLRDRVLMKKCLRDKVFLKEKVFAGYGFLMKKCLREKVFLMNACVVTWFGPRSLTN